MAMIPATISKIVETKVYAALEKEFAAEGKVNKEAKKSWKRQAKVAGIIAKAIIEEIKKTGQVASGIPTAGSPASQMTTLPGKII